ncbi:hypothetical protein ACI784_10010 [Geodermatophilus sp. SYSU D01186]
MTVPTTDLLDQPTTDLLDQLTTDLARAREDLDAARLRQARKDTPDHRAEVAGCRTRIDGLLDLYSSLRAGRVPRNRPRACC